MDQVILQQLATDDPDRSDERRITYYIYPELPVFSDLCLLYVTNYDKKFLC